MGAKFVCVVDAQREKAEGLASRQIQPQPRLENNTGHLLHNTKVANMPGAIQNTVSRLDKPSAYYQSRVCLSIGV